MNDRLAREISSTRAEHRTKLVSGYTECIPLSWKLDVNLNRKERPNRSRRDSSKGRIGRTKVIGATMAMKDYKTFFGKTSGDI
jgi:hypothetical protein